MESCRGAATARNQAVRRGRWADHATPLTGNRTSGEVRPTQGLRPGSDPRRSFGAAKVALCAPARIHPRFRRKGKGTNRTAGTPSLKRRQPHAGAAKASQQMSDNSNMRKRVEIMRKTTIASAGGAALAVAAVTIAAAAFAPAPAPADPPKPPPAPTTSTPPPAPAPAAPAASANVPSGTSPAAGSNTGVTGFNPGGTVGTGGNPASGTSTGISGFNSGGTPGPGGNPAGRT